MTRPAPRILAPVVLACLLAAPASALAPAAGPHLPQILRIADRHALPGAGQATRNPVELAQMAHRAAPQSAERHAAPARWLANRRDAAPAPVKAAPVAEIGTRVKG